MAINFPNSPIAGEYFVTGNLTYQYTGTVWVSVNTKTNNAYNQANTATIIASDAFTQANSSFIHANAAFLAANAAATSANLTIAWNQANSAYVHANSGFNQANSANIYAFGAHRTANSAQVHANAAFLQANQVGGAVSTANGALAAANTNMVFKTGNTMTGNLVMSGANIAFVTATNSGIYWGGTGLSFIYSPAANTLVFGTSSAEDMRIDSSGRVGIGTSSPDYPLSVQSAGDVQITLKNSSGTTKAYIGTAGAFGSAGTDDLRIRSDAANIVFGFSGTETMRHTSAGNFGIGTTAPAATLDVVGSFSDAKANTLSQTLTDAASIAWDASLGRVATITLGGSRTMGAPTNLRVGTYILHVIQGGTGSYTITWNGVFKWTAAVPPTLSTAVGRRDVFSFVSDGTNLYGAMIPDVR